MENYNITKLQLTINADNIKGKIGDELKKYIDEYVCPVVFTHLTAKPKDGGEVGGDFHCTADRGGVRCEGTIGGSVRW